MALYDIYCAEQRRIKVTKAQRAGSVINTFGMMLTGQIHRGGDGGTFGLKAPMSYATFIFIFILFPLLVLIEWLAHS